MSRVAYIAVLLVALAAPAVAYASPDAVIRDCADNGRLDHHYSNSDLTQAEKNLPSDLDEYSDCREVIAGAKTSGSDRRSGGGGGGGGGGGSASGGGGSASGGGGATSSAGGSGHPARRHHPAALPQLTTKAGQRPTLEVGGRVVKPGGNGLFHLSSASNGLPLPLLLALIAVGLLSAAGGFYALRRRVPAIARISLQRPPLPRLDLSRVPFPRFRR